MQPADAANGTITLGAVTGGTSPYTYSVGGGAFTSTTSYTGLTAAPYTVVVRDANGCTFTTSASISNIGGPTALATTVTNSTCGAANGTLTLGAVTGGVSPYTYSVNSGAYTSTTVYSGLAAATYTIDVKDANGCIYSTSAISGQYPRTNSHSNNLDRCSLRISQRDITLGAVTGGTSPYTYSVGGGAFTSTTSYTGLTAAPYTVVVRDANGCTFTTSASISNIGGPTVLATTVTNSTCGAANGTLTLGAVTGGVSPYTYSVNSGAYTSTTVYSGLAAATYTIDVKDANGCIYSTSAIVTIPPDQQP